MSRRTLLVCVALAALLCACHTDARRSASNSIQAGDFVVSLTNIATDPLPSFTISLESALTEGFTLVWQKLCEATLQPPTTENPFYSLVETPNSDVYFSALAWDSSGIWETPQAAGWSFTIPSNTGVWSNLTIGASVLTETETSHVKLDIGLDSYTWYKNDSDTWLVLEAEFYGPPDEEMRADDATIFISTFGAYVLSLENATVTTAGGEPVPLQTLLIPLSSQRFALAYSLFPADSSLKHSIQSGFNTSYDPIMMPEDDLIVVPPLGGPVAWALILIGAAAALLVGGVFMGAIGFFVARRNANARIAERGQLPVKAYVVVATDTTALKTASRSSSYSNV